MCVCVCEREKERERKREREREVGRVSTPEWIGEVGVYAFVEETGETGSDVDWGGRPGVLGQDWGEWRRDRRTCGMPRTR